MVAAAAQVQWRCGSIIESMVIDINAAKVGSLKKLLQVLAGTQVMEFQAAADDAGRMPGLNDKMALKVNLENPVMT